MGLNTTHGAFDGSYGSFGQLRTLVAKKININLNNMVGFGGKKRWENVNDDIKYFLHHSDCDGAITPNQCKLIAKRMDELVLTVTDEEDPTGYFREKMRTFSDGCKLAAKKKEKLEFH
jgi:hypothetical protein